MNFIRSLKWWHWVAAGLGIVAAVYAWKRFRKKGVSVDTITSQINVFPIKKAGV